MFSPWSAVKKLTVNCNIDLKEEKYPSILDTKEKDDRIQISIWRDRDIRMQENGIYKRELAKVREESFSFKRRIICNWKLLKESLTPVEIIDHFISKELVSAELRHRTASPYSERDGCRNFLMSKWTYLTENFYLHTNLIDELCSCGLVDDDRAESIKEKPRRKQVYSTLETLLEGSMDTRCSQNSCRF
ncbi:unnamed protein product [Mytilus edulis]|uniref:Uncharacterized protein n=1 Tax=Mytilus edulis TaxID=6550 RepID=A0A8S3VKZ9_MYTED|nr:unnamed protein product [Mytilus edulis]